MNLYLSMKIATAGKFFAANTEQLYDQFTIELSVYLWVYNRKKPVGFYAY